jgi:polar amino acid transport system substrate-binding protein
MKNYAYIAAALLAGSMTANAQALPEKVKSAGKVIIGTTANYPPVSFKDPKTNQLTGYDIDIGNAIAAKLGIKVEWQETSFEQVLSALSTERIDLYMGGMNDVPERRDATDFVDYMQSGAQFFVQFKRSAEFKSPTDLCGKTVGASRRTNFPAQMARWSEENCVKAGKEPLVIKGTEGSADARAQLRQGRIDAGVQGNESLPYLMSLDPDTYTLVGAPFAPTLQGIAVSKKNPELRDAVVSAVKAIIADGSYQKIVEKYGVQPNAIKTVAVNGTPVK